MSDLQGENLILSFRESAERVVHQVSRIDGVTGIVLQGALVRGFADRFSDVDITTFVTSDAERVRRGVQEIGKVEELRSGHELDLEVHELDQFGNERWSEIRRWDFRNSEIVYDPRGAVLGMITAKLNVPSAFWLKRVVLSCIYTSWYCCPAKLNTPTLLDVSVARGDLLSAHYYANYGIELLLQVLFAMNREFLPPPKWKVFYSQKLSWLPSNFGEELAGAVTVKELSASDLNRRAACLRLLWSEIRARLQQSMGLTHERVVQYYVRNVLKQQM